MSTLDELIARGTLHVIEGRRIVEEQRRRVVAGTAVPGAVELLNTFERTPQIFEDDLERLLKERDSK